MIKVDEDTLGSYIPQRHTSVANERRVDNPNFHTERSFTYQQPFVNQTMRSEKISPEA
jgi:hypothetical protein